MTNDKVTVARAPALSYFELRHCYSRLEFREHLVRLLQRFLASNIKHFPSI